MVVVDEEVFDLLVVDLNVRDTDEEPCAKELSVSFEMKGRWLLDSGAHFVFGLVPLSSSIVSNTSWMASGVIPGSSGLPMSVCVLPDEVCP